MMMELAGTVVGFKEHIKKVKTFEVQLSAFTQYEVEIPSALSPIYTAGNFWHGSDVKKYAYHTDRFSHVNDFAPSTLDQNC